MGKLNNNKGMALIWTYLVAFFLMIMLSGFYATGGGELKQAAKTASDIQAFYLAEAGVDKKLVELNSANTSPIGNTTLGSGSFSVSYDTNTKTITSTGNYGGVSRTVTAVAETSGNNMPPGVKGALTAPSQLFVILGIVIDGREHDSLGNLTGAPGTYGISYGAEPTFDGWIFPQIGGNGAAPDQPVPSQAKFDMEAEDSADCVSPLAVFGLPADSTLLNSYKHTSAPSQPLNNQIYFFTPTKTGSIFNPAATINLGGGSGILIVDKASGHDSWVRFRGEFTGLVICNNCKFDANTQITGAVISVDTQKGDIMGANPGQYDLEDYARILYSSEVLENLPPIAGVTNESETTIKDWIDHQNTAGRLTSS